MTSNLEGLRSLFPEGSVELDVTMSCGVAVLEVGPGTVLLEVETGVAVLLVVDIEAVEGTELGIVAGVDVSATNNESLSSVS